MTHNIRHIVRQFNWLLGGKYYVRAPGERRIAWFDTAAEAVADQRSRDSRFRETHNPFFFGTAWPHFTTMPAGVYRDWLLDDWIEPPANEAATVEEWRTWWDAVKPTLNQTQRERAWDGLNRLRFHDVIARRSSETAYCVSRLLWAYDDS